MSLRRADGDRLPLPVAKGDEGMVGRLIQVLLDAGIDGLGPLKSARELAAVARSNTRTPEGAVKKIIRSHVVKGGVGGFVTGVGGFVTMPVALPANVVEFYVGATRMVAGIATLRGYDLDDPQVRSAVLLTLIGSDADDVLAKAGLTGASGKVVGLVGQQLPPAALLMLNKAIGFRILRGVGEKAFARLGRAVPLAGGVVGGGIDVWMMKRIADHALSEFPPVGPTGVVVST
jgi:EcsC protein family